MGEKMSDPCQKDAIINEFSTRFTRLEQKDEFKDRLLDELKKAIDKIGVHMEKQTLSIQQIVVQESEITHLRKQREEDRALIEKLFKTYRELSDTMTAINNKLSNDIHQLQLKPGNDALADTRKIKTNTMQTIINTVISSVVSALVGGTAAMIAVAKLLE